MSPAVRLGPRAVAVAVGLAVATSGCATQYQKDRDAARTPGAAASPAHGSSAPPSSARPTERHTARTQATPRPTPSTRPPVGFAAEDPNAIVAAANTATFALRSVHAVGEEDYDGAPVHVDVVASGSGDCQGTISSDEVGTVAILTIAGVTWIRPDDTFWHRQEPAAADRIIAAVAGRYVTAPALTAALVPLCDIRTLADFNDDTGLYVTSGTSDQDGQATVVVRLQRGGADLRVGYIEVAEPHYYARIDVTGSVGPSELRFDRFDAAFSPRAPRPSDVLDLSAGTS